MEFRARNADNAFYQLVKAIHTRAVPIVETTSRAGDVIQVTEPVVLTFTKSWECVLFNRARDCNPFFHLAEALWMLAGRRDVRFIAHFNPRMREFSDDGDTLNGAYGWRWRRAAGRTEEVETGIGMVPEYTTTDQLEEIVRELRNKPDSRRCVLQMWNVEDDLLKIGTSKDVCCNTNVYFLMVNNRLEMTVCNRSNDLVWGMLGSNVVTFAFLQSYVASKLHVMSGCMHQITNNLHVYKNNWKPEEWMEAAPAGPDDYYWSGTALPLWTMLGTREFERDLKHLDLFVVDPRFAANSMFFRHTVQPMFRAFNLHKKREYDQAIAAISTVPGNDWINAAGCWLQRRADAYSKRTKEQGNEAASADQG